MRLIDADALIPMMKYATTDNEIGIFPIRIGFESIVKVIESTPTIDAVSLVESMPSAERHGRWIDKYNDGDWHCSECGAIVEKDEQNRHNWYRCYHCGADMRERGK